MELSLYERTLGLPSRKRRRIPVCRVQAMEELDRFFVRRSSAPRGIKASELFIRLLEIWGTPL